jgi:hypothetical protein
LSASGSGGNLLASTPLDTPALPSPDKTVTALPSRTTRRRLVGGCVLVLVTLTGCRHSSRFVDAAYAAAAATTAEVTLSRRIDDLASDSMLGRGPGQRGDTLTVAYLEREMRAIGLAPGGNDGYRQPVTLRRLHATGGATFRANGQIVPLDSTTVIMAATTAGEHTVHDAPVVFVGHGIVAPEHQWDDYGAVDLRGKVALILDGEPDIVSARRFGTITRRGPHAFSFLKARHALARGARAAVLIRTGTDAAHRARRARLQDAITGDAPDPTAEPPITLHLSASAGWQLARAAGTTLDAWRRAAADSTIGPLELPLRLDATVRAEGDSFVSYNVVGTVPGSDPSRRDECVVYLGHWDGFGIGPAVNGDSIYNGALDNAAGVSEMLLIAEAVRTLPRAPRRTMVFVATTAEESGMRGANVYAAHPICTMERTVLAIGMDWSWTWGMTDTVVSNGIGYSTVDSLARRVATRLGKSFTPGVGEYWLASDHAVLAFLGVPAWFGGMDGDVIGKPRGWAAAQLATQQTHVPFDQRKPAWDLSGALFEVRFLFELGVRTAESDTRPVWTVDSEFRRAADALRGVRRTGAK